MNFHKRMVQEWISLGHDVTCISIEPPEEMENQCKEIGASYYQVAGSRTGIGIGSGLKMIKDYRKAFETIKPDICFLIMSKPIAFGGIAAIKAKVPRIFVFQGGLEIAFYSGGMRNAFIRTVLKILYRYVQLRCETVFFICKSDIEKMVKWKTVRREQVQYVDGPGVEMDRFTRKPMPDRLAVAMTARLVWSKGVREYIEAAEIVKKKYPNAVFYLVGGLDTNDESLKKEELDELVQRGIIKYCGFQKDVRPYLERCSIFVLPSYHEGKGKSIQEAMAVGRPVITTTAPGCSETVIDGYNGYKVPVKDGKAIAEKIIYLHEHPELEKEMADHAYEFCKKTFDINIINQAILKRMKLIDDEQ